MATFVSDKSREQIEQELNVRLSGQGKPRIYIITKALGGKFIFGKRKFPSWKGYTEVESESGDET